MERVIFTKKMRKDYTILMPDMLPIHFSIVEKIFRAYGYRAELLTNTGAAVIEAGLKYVHNDACYPVQLVVGQFIDALQSGKYDTRKTALLLTQTGGGCRASNYIPVLRKALREAGMEYIPVISLSTGGIESNPGFRVTLPMIIRAIYGVLFGDLLMQLQNQCLPYEVKKGQTSALVSEWTERIAASLGTRGSIGKKKINGLYAQIAQSFEKIEKTGEKKPRVGIVGEIFVKFSPLGNNEIEKFLLSEDSEPVMPGLLNFGIYCLYNTIQDYRLYRKKPLAAFLCGQVINYANKITRRAAAVVEANCSLIPPQPFEHMEELTRGYISNGVKMGEGWLLVAEISELLRAGVKNIVCVQPFGCLPNHIVAKGTMKRLLENNPGTNIVAIDYDPGMTKVNQENRLRLMLANARA